MIIPKLYTREQGKADERSVVHIDDKSDKSVTSLSLPGFGVITETRREREQ